MNRRSQRFQHGLDVYDAMTADKFENRFSPGLAELERDFPFLVDAALSYAIGEVWGRSEIDDKAREFAMIAALGALGAGGYVQLRQHAAYALTFGANADELRELVYLTTVSAGFPRALNMAAEIKAVLDEASIGPAGPEPDGGGDRHALGLARMAMLGRVAEIDVAAHPVLGPLSKDFPFLVAAVVDYSMGEVWTRGALDPALRQIAAVAAFGALGDAWPQMRLHVGHALRLGVLRETLKEVINILTVAAGFPVALNAAAEMRKVFEDFDKESTA
ncbi:MAG: carboxymuconolactone decarboxylase family protein [Phycisphaerales bacterium]|nr:carboxymuconolactone decarboxylase family protein [Hyphomonadaceae bacterium]